jgi:hypothetical protein
VEAEARHAQQAYEALDPARTAAALRVGLAAVRDLAQKVAASGLGQAAQFELRHRLAGKESDFEAALALAHGVSLEADADDGDVVRGQTFTVKARVWNQGPEPLRIEGLTVHAPDGWTVARTSDPPPELAAGRGLEIPFAVTVAPGARYSAPYWRRDPKRDRYAIDVPGDEGLPWGPPDVVAEVRFAIGGVPASVSRPVWRRYEGRWVGGEKQKVVNVVPALSVSVSPGIAVVPRAAASRRELRVTTVNNQKRAAEAMLRLEAPAGWTVDPLEVPLHLRYEGEEVTSRFFVTSRPGLGGGEYPVRAVAVQDGREFREGYQVIAYDHIQERHLFRPAVARVEAIDVKVAPGISVGYVVGTGDEVPAAIRQLGARLTLLGPDDLAYGDLARFTTIVTGIRAYERRADLRANNHRLLQYASDGGHVVVQYNKFDFNRLSTESVAGGFAGESAVKESSPFAPYPAAVTSNRVTVEDAPITVLVPQHPFFHTPNAIGEADWQGWVQERGLYFLDARDPHYVELLSSTDPWPRNPGEKKGLLVDAPVGRGTWTYVGLGLWRQLPAGTPGAYRLLANIVSRPRG